MQLVDILKEERISLRLEACDKISILRQLARLFAENDEALDEEQVFRAFEERENLVSTGVGSGVAIPHGRLDGVTHVALAVVICRKGVGFNSADGRPVQIFAAVLAPFGHPVRQLKTLACVARLLTDERIRNRLLNAKDCKDVYQIMIEEALRLGERSP